MLKDRGLGDVSPTAIFRSPPLRARQALFQHSAENDPSFNDYLESKSLSVSNLSTASPEMLDTVIRKVTPLLKIRSVARKKQKKGDPAKYNSNKALIDYYSGIDQLFDLLEGNPRWIIGVMTPLLDEYQKTGKSINPDKQLKEVKAAMDKFSMLLKTIPSPIKACGSQQFSIESIIDVIGLHFKKSIILDDFKDEPCGSFKVDSEVSSPIQESLGAALNAGALIHVNGNLTEVFLGDLTNHRFRLSYLLAPKFLIPLNLMKEVSLSSILRNENGNYELFE